jgi:hypothetical protein
VERVDTLLLNVHVREKKKMMTRRRDDKKKEKNYKKDKKFFKKKYNGEAHIEQEWESSDESSESKSDDLATIAIKVKSSLSKSLLPNLSKHTCLMAKESKKKVKKMLHPHLNMFLVMRILLVMKISFQVMIMNLSLMNFEKSYCYDQMAYEASKS